MIMMLANLVNKFIMMLAKIIGKLTILVGITTK